MLLWWMLKEKGLCFFLGNNSFFWKMGVVKVYAIGNCNVSVSRLILQVGKVLKSADCWLEDVTNWDSWGGIFGNSTIRILDWELA